VASGQRWNMLTSTSRQGIRVMCSCCVLHVMNAEKKCETVYRRSRDTQVTEHCVVRLRFLRRRRFLKMEASGSSEALVSYHSTNSTRSTVYVQLFILQRCISCCIYVT
jgi:hypothetical protein